MEKRYLNGEDHTNALTQEDKVKMTRAVYALMRLYYAATGTWPEWNSLDAYRRSTLVSHVLRAMEYHANFMETERTAPMPRSTLQTLIETKKPRPRPLPVEVPDTPPPPNEYPEHRSRLSVFVMLCIFALMLLVTLAVIEAMICR